MREGRCADEKRRLSPHERAYARAVEEITANRISLESFRTAMQGSDSVDRDLRTVERIKARFDQPRNREEKIRRERAIILEAIIDDCIDMGMWLGDSAAIRKTSEYDDIVNGVDSLVEFSEDEGARFDFAALAFDVTSRQELSDKMQRLKQEIMDGRLAEIKYYEDADGDTQATLKNIPRLILSVNPEQIEKLMQQYGSDDRKDRNELYQDPIRLQILAQIRIQLETYRHYASSIGKHKTATRYQSLFGRLEAVFDDAFQEPSFEEYVASVPEVLEFERSIEEYFA